MADFKIYRENVNKDNWFLISQEAIEELKQLGTTFFRITPFEDNTIIILEGWKIQPLDQGPEPKLTDVIGFGT